MQLDIFQETEERLVACLYGKLAKAMSSIVITVLQECRFHKQYFAMQVQNPEAALERLPASV